MVAAAVYAFTDLLLGQRVETTRATRTDLVQSVVASGRIATPQRVSVAAELTGRVRHVPVAEGQQVKRGDLLIELDDRDERAAVEQARASVAQSTARLRQLRELALPASQHALLQAQANYVQAQRHLKRTEDLKAKGFVSDSALDDARRAYDVAQSQVGAAELQVSTNSPQGSDVALAQAALLQAQANLRAGEAKLEQTRIRAPADGTLIGRSVEAGTIAQAGKELMVLAPTGVVQAVIQVDEKNLARLRLGQKAVGSADAFPNERFDAEVVYINPGVDATRGSVEVKLAIKDPPARLMQDMTVSVDIEVARRTGAVVVSTDAVFDVNGEPWVLAVAGHRAQRRAVKLGLRTEGSIEVASGVSVGDVLIAGGNGQVRDGQRVRPRDQVRTGIN